MRKIIIIIVVFLVFIGLIPTLASFPPFKQIFVNLLERKVNAKVQVENLHLSWFGPQVLKGVHFTTAELNGTIQEIAMDTPLWDLSNLSIAIANGTINTPAGSIQEIKGTLKGDQINITSQNFTVQGTRDNFNFTAANMPTAFAEWLLKTNLLTPTIGATFDAKGSSSTNAFSIDLSAPTAQLSLSTSITPDAYTLTKPLTATFRLTPALVDYPITGIDLAKLRIANGSYPRNFSLDKVQINDATLDLGRVQIQHPKLDTLATFLKSNSLNTDSLTAWLTATDFSLKEGRLTLSRTDALLANAIHLCSWGRINLVKDRLHLILGVPADTLSSTFGIKNISNDYVLQISVSGSLKDPKFNTSSVGPKLAALIAAGQVQKQGGIIGGVAGVIKQAAQEKAPAAKRPFPWE